MPKRKLDPLPSAAFQILLSLVDDELHGYAIMRQVADQTAGRMRLGPGTLYSPTFHREQRTNSKLIC
jgi:DNA-binding PadR family transcriptional regulator